MENKNENSHSTRCDDHNLMMLMNLICLQPHEHLLGMENVCLVCVLVCVRVCWRC